MKRKRTFAAGFVLTVGALGSGAWGFQQLRAAQEPVKPLVFETLEQKIGVLPVGEVALVRFSVRNTGSRPVRIAGVETDCGCASPRYPEILGPGERGEILVRFEPLQYWSGRVQKTLKLLTALPHQGEVPLTIIADVAPLVEVTPSGPVTLQYTPGQTLQKELRLRPRAGAGIRLGEPEVDSPLVKVSLVPSNGGSGAEYRLSLVIGPLKGPGDVRAAVEIPTGSQRFPSVLLPVVALAITGPVVSPKELTLLSRPDRPVGEEQGRLQVFTRTGRLRILEVDPGVSGLKPEVVVKNSGTFYEVVLRSTREWKGQVANGSLTVRTDDKTHPTVSVPIRLVH